VSSSSSVSELLYSCYFTYLLTIVYANTPSPTYRHPHDTDHPHTVTPVVSVECPLQWTLARSRGYRRRHCRCRCRLLSITCPSPRRRSCIALLIMLTARRRRASHLPIQHVPVADAEISHRDKRWQTSKQYPTRLNVLHPSLVHNGEHSAVRLMFCISINGTTLAAA